MNHADAVEPLATGETFMQVTALYKSKQPVISMEFFPPRNDEAREKFPGVVSRLCRRNPDFFTVTFGAGGSTQEGTYRTVSQLMTATRLPTVAHVAGAGLGPDELGEVLDRFRDMGVENLFVVRGDEPKDGSFSLHPQGFPYASDMIAFIRERYDFTIGCAGYPEGHVASPDLDRDIENLRIKVLSGADYIVTQYFHDNEYFFAFVDKCRARGIEVPIIPGIMPVYSVELTHRLAGMCGASIPDLLRRSLDRLTPADSDAALELGIEYALAQCRDLLSRGVPGLHFYTMDRSRSTGTIIDRLRREGLV